MNKSPKLITSFSYIVPEAKPLTLKEVLQLRDGIKISRHLNPSVPQKITLLPILENIKHLNSLN
jgi:hypothetical protein